MSRIKPEVYIHHLREFPHDERILKPFTKMFEVAFGTRWKSANAELSIFLLTPSKTFSDAYGIRQDIILAYSQWPTIQARTFQSIKNFMSDPRHRGRIEKTVVLVVSDVKDAIAWSSAYFMQNSEFYVPIIFNTDDLLVKSRDPDYLFSRFSSSLYHSDWFDFGEPIREDTFFFGRSELCQELVAAMAQSRNRGIFGLRRVGKSSVLLKSIRDFEETCSGKAIFINCIDPSIQEKKQNDLLNHISQLILQAGSLSRKNVERFAHPSERFTESCRLFCRKQKLALVFDEIEYISFFATQNPHWCDDFIPFWQSIKSTQQHVGNVSVVVAGVNPKICEEPRVCNVPNPMLGHFGTLFVRGLERDELENMISFFGSRMGVVFQQDAIDSLYTEYAGHPLLTRIACSTIHRQAERQREKRPLIIDARRIRNSKSLINSTVKYYCEYIISDLEMFYPTELEILEKIASNDIAGHLDFVMDGSFLTHIRQYGLCTDEPIPTISVNVLRDYIRQRATIRSGHRLGREIVSISDRPKWVEERLSSLIAEMRKFSDLLRKRKKVCCLSGKKLFDNQERLFPVVIPSDRNQFLVVMSRLYQTFVEPLQMATGEFFGTLCSEFPFYQKALHRIRVYRHSESHSVLQESVQSQLDTFLHDDLEGRSVTQFPDAWFSLLQISLDELFIAILKESTKQG